MHHDPHILFKDGDVQNVKSTLNSTPVQTTPSMTMGHIDVEYLDLPGTIQRIVSF